MLDNQRPMEVETSHHTCDYHKKHPERRDYPGCTCSGSWTSRVKKWDEMTEEEKTAHAAMWWD